jgi:hypothetical protein
MWKALRSRKHLVKGDGVYYSEPGFRASLVDGRRVLTRRCSGGVYVTFCPTSVAHKLPESEDGGVFDNDDVEQTKGPVADDTCAICLDAVDKPAQAFIGLCGHTFHKACVKGAWVRGLRKCATCRCPFDDDLFMDGPECKEMAEWAALKYNWHFCKVVPRLTRAMDCHPLPV